MIEAAGKLRPELATCGRRGHAEPYPDELRQRAVYVGESLHMQGMSWSRAARELGIHAGTLCRWREAEAADGLVPVEVLEEEEQEMVLVPSCGARVEGLSVGQLVTLVRALL